MSADLSVAPLFGFCPFALLPDGNIMLNNICDVEHDTAVGRFTLAFYLKKRALYLFALLYYAAYLSVIAMVISVISPEPSVLLTDRSEEYQPVLKTG